MKQYRRKFILEDGRKIYASKRGQIALISQDSIDKTTNFSLLAYSPDLSIMSTVSLMKSENHLYVRVVAQVFEPATDPLDPEAFLSGGIKPP